MTSSSYARPTAASRGRHRSRSATSTRSASSIRTPVTAFRTGDVIPDIAAGVTAGRVYAAWQDGSFSGPPRGKEHAGIAFSQSLDGGLTWTTKIQINQVPATQAFIPSVAVAADGTVGVTYYDFRNNTPAPGLTD